MARRQQLSETRLAELFDPPAEQREMVRHYTLSGADLAAMRRDPWSGNAWIRLVSHRVIPISAAERR